MEMPQGSRRMTNVWSAPWVGADDKIELRSNPWDVFEPFPMHVLQGSIAFVLSGQISFK